MSHFPKNKTFLKMTSLDEKKHDSSSGGNPRMGKSPEKFIVIFLSFFSFFHSPESCASFL